MKTPLIGIGRFSLAFAMLIAGVLCTQAGTIIWTNTAGGNWSEAASWFPNSIPSTGDDAFITNSGTYDVTLDTSPTVNSLTIGGSSGTQTFHTATSELSVNSFCVVSTNGAFDLEGGALSGPGDLTVKGTFTWTGGSLANGGPSTTVEVATNGLMLLAGGYDTLYGTITNAGTMQFTGANLVMFGACYNNYASLINLRGGVVDFQGDFGILALCGTEVMANFGTVLKSAGMNTSEVSAPFYNSGLLDVESGTVSLAGTYSLADGTINIGISNLTDFGVVNLGGDPAQLGGSITATLSGDYQPIATNVFPVVSYTSAISGFTNANLPYADAWQTNYSDSDFSLIVLNARPMIGSISDQSIGEFSTLFLDASATDADQPPQTLTYSLTNAPPGMTIDPSTGALSWTPEQTQSPSTNIVTAVVTDNGAPPLSASTSFRVVVVEENLPPVWPAIGMQMVNESTLLTVNSAATESNIHATITSYGLINPPAGAAISTNGVFTWKPTQSQGPSTNTITTVATDDDPFAVIDPSLAATNSFTVIVVAPTLAPIPNYTLEAGQTLMFTITATENDPARALTFSLDGAPASATVGGASGVFVWQPGSAYTGTTNTFTVAVTDNSVPPLSASQSFTVYVNKPSPSPILGSARFSGGQFQFQVNGPVGSNYVIEAASSLSAAQWTNLQTITPVVTPFTFTDTNSIQSIQLYRVELLP